MKALPRSILYFGSNSPTSTSRHRADALRRLGCEVTVVDPEELIGPRSRWQAFLDYRTGYCWLQKGLLLSLNATVEGVGNNPDLIWVNGGELLGPGVMRLLRQLFSCPMLLYQNDDPTGRRDGSRFDSLRRALPFYDLCVLVRPETALEALAMGASRVLTVFMSFDEIQHTPSETTSEHPPEPVVSFVGTFIPGEARDVFLLNLIRAGLPLRLIGNRWQRSRHWTSLQRIYQGPSLSGASYGQALGSAAVSLGMLSHQNRDLITTRSLETPACGGLLCAERTSEHQLLYEQGQEAMFWSSILECIELCSRLLAEPQHSSAIRAAGLQAVRRLGVGNEDICRQILAALALSCS
jgi:hypothetical protein